MVAPVSDPYKTLGVSPDASDAELRAAYRRLVQLHHPDHNDGSPESTRRFEEVQAAYAQVRAERSQVPRAQRAQAPHAEPSRARARASADPEVEAKLADLERELREARAARERARRAAAEAAAATEKRPSDEELGYVKTDDSFSKLFDDGLAELASRLRRLRGE
jgi:curved DNA-binding protein CbpA